ncbi:MAG TPA: TPM domain-containing protein, partial [Chitinophagales bacterium]|nr:TPM domain-containing protein [Chitinophagales bacterium]
MLAFCFALLSIIPLRAQQYPERPNPPRLVNDLANVLQDDDANALEAKLVAYNDSTSTQIAIVIIKTLDGLERAQYATELAEKWGIGRKNKDNGVLLLVAMKEHQVFIATGRGVEEYLPDAICNEVIDNDIKPHFKRGDYYGGLNTATDEMIARLQGQFTNEGNDSGGHFKLPALWIVIILILL